MHDKTYKLTGTFKASEASQITNKTGPEAYVGIHCVCMFKKNVMNKKCKYHQKVKKFIVIHVYRINILIPALVSLTEMMTCIPIHSTTLLLWIIHIINMSLLPSLTDKIH